MNRPLVSVIILTYNNYKFLYEAIDSVLFQDYPEIELVISNDGSSDFFESEVIDYLNHNRKNNIKHILIKNHNRNVGTVKNVNLAIKDASGQYVILLAGDDVFANDQVVTKYISSMLDGETKYMIANSQVELFDRELKISDGLVCSESDKYLLWNLSPIELFRELSDRGCFFPTTCCIDVELFKLIGYINEEYRLIEDFPLFLSVFRHSIKVLYIDFVTLKHRHGGIVHGNENNHDSILKQYYKDEIAVIRNEILPYKSLLGSKLYAKTFDKYKKRQITYELKYEFISKSFFQKMSFVLGNLPYFIKKLIKVGLLRLSFYSSYLWERFHFNFLIAGGFFILLANYTQITTDVNSSMNVIYHQILIFSGIFSFILELYLMIFTISRYILQDIRTIIRSKM